MSEQRPAPADDPASVGAPDKAVTEAESETTAQSNFIRLANWSFFSSIGSVTLLLLSFLPVFLVFASTGMPDPESRETLSNMGLPLLRGASVLPVLLCWLIGFAGSVVAIATGYRAREAQKVIGVATGRPVALAMFGYALGMLALAASLVVLVVLFCVWSVASGGIGV